MTIIFKPALFWLLKILARATIKKYQPQVIGITGSVGKTSAKEAIACVLSAKFSIRRAKKNYNNEIGVPLTILGSDLSAGKNIFGWFKIFCVAIKNLLINDKNYPKVLILEMGADRPGNIDYLVDIAPPHIAVITAIGSSHLEFFGSVEKILAEKSRILNNLASADWAVLNNDDANLQKLITQTKHNFYTFGEKSGSTVTIEQVHLSQKDGNYGTSFKLKFKGTETPVFLANVLGKQQALAAASAASVGLIMGLNLVEISQSLASYKSALGRTNLIKGIKNTWIIDDTYNASPQSTLVALEILKDFPLNGRKIAIFGDMRELGSFTEEGHRQVGEMVVKFGIDYLFVVGEKSRDIARVAKDMGMIEDHIYHFAQTVEAGIFLQERLKPNDIILIKGSRGSKMEQVVYEIMARPWEVDEFLVAKISR